jgi:hypothetical protein
MNIRSRILIISAAVAFLFVVFFVTRPPSTSLGQQNFPEPNRKPACSIFCGDGTMNYVVLANPPACFGGPLPAGNAGDYFKDLPNETKNATCQKLRSTGRTASSCPAFKTLMAACGGSGPEEEPPPAKKKCEEPAPWFDGSKRCTDIQSPVIAKTGNGVSLTMCGLEVYHWVPPTSDPLLNDAYKQILEAWIRSHVGSKVCCSAIRNASRNGTACNPATDIDCDGRPNQSDVTHYYSGGPVVPDINMSTSANGADVDPFPPGLDPNDINFRPERTGRNSKGVGECACKWELIKGDMKCSRGLRPHVYTATWRCPSTGAEVFTTKRFPGSSRCK